MVTVRFGLLWGQWTWRIVSWPALRALSSSGGFTGFTPIALPTLDFVCPFRTKIREEMARIFGLISPGNGEMAEQSPRATCPWLQPFTNISSKTVEKNSLKPKCVVISDCGYRSSTMDIKLNKSTNKNSNNFWINIKYVASDFRLTFHNGRAQTPQS